MILAFTAAALVAGAFVQLGALSVKVSVLTFALKCLGTVAVLAALGSVWTLYAMSRR